MGSDHDQHHHAKHPDPGTVEHVVEEIGVLIERFRAHENDEVADEVTGEE